MSRRDNPIDASQGVCPLPVVEDINRLGNSREGIRTVKKLFIPSTWYIILTCIGTHLLVPCHSYLVRSTTFSAAAASANQFENTTCHPGGVFATDLRTKRDAFFSSRRASTGIVSAKAIATTPPPITCLFTFYVGAFRKGLHCVIRENIRSSLL